MEDEMIECGPESTEKVSRIQELLNQLSTNEEVISKTLSNLIAKIEPVLNPTASSGDSDKQEALAAYSPLAEKLQEVSIKQRKNIRSLETIIEDIEL
jgi:adenylosuccinate synthase